MSDSDSEPGIVTRLFGPVTSEQRFVVTPLLDRAQIDEAGFSVDLRLGSNFVTHQRRNVTSFDPADPLDPSKLSDAIKAEQHFHVDFGKEVVVHPGQFILGISLEYISMPKDMMAYVIGRSTLGRMGLVVATAIGIHPGFQGCLTLELANIGEVPIKMRPGMRIGQLFLHAADGSKTDKITSSRYRGAVRPEGIAMMRDPEAEKISQLARYKPTPLPPSVKG